LMARVPGRAPSTGRRAGPRPVRAARCGGGRHGTGRGAAWAEGRGPGAPPRLSPFALLFPLLIPLLGIGANVALGARPPPPETWASWPSLLVVFPLVVVLGGA